MQNDKWFLIINPVSGNGKALRDADKISSLLDAANINHQKVFSEYSGHTTILTQQALQKGFTKFIGCGGDGTLNEIINGIFCQSEIDTKQIILALIPVGTGNDWCKTSNIPLNYKGAIEAIANGNFIMHDIGKVISKNENKVSEKYFINIAGAGFDGFVVNKINHSKSKNKGGKLFYMLQVVRNLFKYKPQLISYEVNGLTYQEKIFSIAVAICKFNGGGMMQAPNAIADDGLLDVTIIGNLSPWQVIRNLKSMKDGSFTKHVAVKTYRSNQIKLFSADHVLVETDGENSGTAPATFSIFQNAVKMIVNK